MDLLDRHRRRPPRVEARQLNRRRTLTAAAAVLVLGLAGCGGDDTSDGGASPGADAVNDVVPAELSSACGHPGTEVTLKDTKLPVTVNKSACDLAGVVIHWRKGTDTVPGGADPPVTTCDSDASGACPSISIGADGAVTIEPT